MSTLPRNETHKHVTVWLPYEQLAGLDAHLTREVARVPGARASRHSWLAALVARELAALGAHVAEQARPDARR